jgi:hypothetical protein
VSKTRNKEYVWILLSPLGSRGSFDLQDNNIRLRRYYFCIGGRIIDIHASFLPGCLLPKIPYIPGRLADHCALIFSAARQNQSLTPIELANSRRKMKRIALKGI